MKLHDAYQRLVEKVFFGGRSTRLSEAVSFIAANIFLYGVVFFFLLNTVVYDWTGSLYSHGFHLNTALDNLIPFVPEWAIFYLYLFYPLTGLTIGWFALADHRRGYALAFSLILINVVADLVYIVFPVTTDIYRQALLAHPLVGNAFASAMYAHYAKDPSFNCFPSLHAAIATITFYAWHRYAQLLRSRLVRGISIGMLVVGIGVVLSTLFVKQHYIADEVAGILLAWLIGKWMFASWERHPKGGI